MEREVKEEKRFVTKETETINVLQVLLKATSPIP